MRNEEKTKEQLIDELAMLRQQVGELRALTDKHMRDDETLPESVNGYRMLFEGAGDAIFILEAEGEKTGQIVAANRAAADMHGYIVHELLSLNIKDLDGLDAAKDAPERIRRMLNGEWIKAEIIHRRKNGTFFPVEISAGLMELGDHKYILAFDRDITERKRTEEALRESEEKYRSLVESTDDSIYLVDMNGRYLFMNKKHLSRLNLPEGEFLGRTYGEFHSQEETDEFVGYVTGVLKTGSSVQYEHRSSRGGRYYLRTLNAVKKSDGQIFAVTVISKDITHLKQMEEKLSVFSFTDDLTGLCNRRAFFALVEQQLKLSRRLKKGVFMLYADLDNLKTINDTFGHQEGDRALIDIANVLKTTFRDADIVGRIGGDEFVVIPIGTTEDNIKIVTDRLQKVLQIHNAGSKRGYTLSVSFGVSYYDPGNPSTIDELLRHAEKLMYEQKRLKRKS
ncbi:MAG: sensor domain-containing diguanylate cyclase [Thermodesulfovibrionales bacterium]